MFVGGWRWTCRIRDICRSLLGDGGGLVELEPFVGVCWGVEVVVSGMEVFVGFGVGRYTITTFLLHVTPYTLVLIIDNIIGIVNFNFK